MHDGEVRGDDGADPTIERLVADLDEPIIGFLDSWHAVNAARDRFLHRVRAELRLSPSEQRILWKLLRGARTPGELIERTALGKATISTSARTLHERGLIERDETDGVLRYRLSPRAAELLLEYNGCLVEHAERLARDPAIARAIAWSNHELARAYDAAAVGPMRPNVDALVAALDDGDTATVERLLRDAVGTFGSLDAACMLVQEASERIIVRDVDGPKVERAVALARRGLGHVHAATRAARGNGLFAVAIHPEGDRHRLCSYIAGLVLEHVGWTVLPVDTLGSREAVQALLDEVDPRLAVIAAPTPETRDEVRAIVEGVLAHRSPRQVVIVGADRMRFAEHGWGDRVSVAGPEALRELASSIAREA